MSNSLICLENIDAHICLKTNKVYLDSGKTITPAARDELIARKIEIVYGSPPKHEDTVIQETNHLPKKSIQKDAWQIDRLPERIQRLKDAYLNVKPSLVINRAKAFTEITKKFQGLSPILVRAMAFRKACEDGPLLIQPDELIIGHPNGKARAGSFSPDISWRWLAEELDTIESRAQDPYEMTLEDKETLRREIFPFWQNRSVDEICEKRFRDAGIWEFSSEAMVADLSYHHTSGGGDTSPGYDIILFTKGFLGIKAEAEANLAKLSLLSEEDMDKANFYKAAIQTCEGVMTYSNRLSNYAATLAQQEKNPKRKAELEKISAIAARVPAHPPQNFHEALQALWTTQSLFALEENQASVSLGRVDQYMFPLYDADIKSGRLTQDEAFELMASFIIKCSEYIWLVPTATAEFYAGYMPFMNLTVGGQKRLGGDATNDLTYLIMDAVRLVGVYQPSLTCRVHNFSPDKYLKKMMDVLKAGFGMPAIFFDDAHIKMMLRKGYSYDDARDYNVMGCVEPQKSGRTYQWTSGALAQWPITIELVFNRGIVKWHGTKQGLDTGPLEQFTTYELFDEAVKKQLHNIQQIAARGTIINEILVRDTVPKPYMSLLVEGCMESGKDVTSGGAFLYEGPGHIYGGLATYVDSMAAIKKLVYEERKYTLNQLKQAIDANWIGYEKIRQDCISAPKFGNDDDFVDEIAKDILHYTETIHNETKSLYARMIHGTLAMSFNTPLGKLTAASPDGRVEGAPLSDGMSPTQGADIKGPTAIIKSASKLNVENMSLGMTHNFKLLKGTLDTQESQNNFMYLLRTASMLGLAQMQFNYVDDAVLLDAQKNPEKHRGLIVRVAGYSAFFAELCKDVQDEIISRTLIKDIQTF